MQVMLCGDVEILQAQSNCRPAHMEAYMLERRTRAAVLCTQSPVTNLELPDLLVELRALVHIGQHDV